MDYLFSALLVVAWIIYHCALSKKLREFSKKNPSAFVEGAFDEFVFLDMFLFILLIFFIPLPLNNALIVAICAYAVGHILSKKINRQEKSMDIAKKNKND